MGGLDPMDYGLAVAVIGLAGLSLRRAIVRLLEMWFQGRELPTSALIGLWILTLALTFAGLLILVFTW